jgi:hypothetical protein
MGSFLREDKKTMRLPIIQGIIDRRILVNYCVDPTALRDLVPSPFRPKRVNGMGIAGICFTRLKRVRPRHMPERFGLASENVAHRIAVEWEENGAYREGVYIPWQATSSRFNIFAGGKLFPGVLAHANFQSKEDDETFSIQVASDDRQIRLTLEAHTTCEFPQTSVFASSADASAFFERGSLGYSVTKQPGKLDGLGLECVNWKVEPLQVTKVTSSFFDDQERFPSGSANLDCVLLMRAIAHEWHAQKPLHVTNLPQTLTARGGERTWGSTTIHR